jgi:peptide/nickel transport system substrate-binding protein
MEYSVQAENPKVNELVKEYWGAVGINVQLKEETTADLRANSATNTLDLGVWSYTFYFEPKLIGDPIRLYPAWGDGSQYMAGKPWLDWYRSAGAEGQEPPDEIKELFNLVEQWVTTIPGTDEYIELGKQIMTINVNNLYLIGTVGQVPGPTIISNKLGNVPAFTVQSSDYSRTLPFRVDQWYFK